VGQPVRLWVQARVDRLVYGHRDDPVHLLAALGRELTDLTEGAALQSLVDALRAGLRLGGVHVTSEDGQVEASSGRLGTAVHSMPLVAEGRRVGHLRVAAPSGVSLDARTRRAVDQLLGLVAVTLELALVNERLRAAGDRVVEVRHEERRMIRRDLHDGMGPALAGVGLGLAAARRRLGHDPEGTARLLAELEAEVERRTEDVRLFARALLPPQLDDGDLARALEVLADRFRTSGLVVEVDTADLGAVDVGRQVAIYHVAAEALMNAYRHAQATAVRVRLTSRADGAVALEVVDDGEGLAGRAAAGVTSMRARSAELGGALDAGPRGDLPGTRVRMVLP
jgi:signal transduction histidine kinase